MGTVTPTGRLRAQRETACLRALSDGPLTRTNVQKRLARDGDPISDHTVHTIMLDLAERGLVTVGRTKIKGMFSSFAFRYELRGEA